ncbi:MAG: hypothetical protein ACRD15_01520, partial [Vicinamibacterales bacterium]
MKSQILIAAAVVAWVTAPASFVGGPSVQETSTVPAVAELRTMIARFAPVDIGADLSYLSTGD